MKTILFSLLFGFGVCAQNNVRWQELYKNEMLSTVTHFDSSGRKIFEKNWDNYSIEASLYEGSDLKERRVLNAGYSLTIYYYEQERNRKVESIRTITKGVFYPEIIYPDSFQGKLSSKEMHLFKSIQSKEDLFTLEILDIESTPKEIWSETFTKGSNEINKTLGVTLVQRYDKKGRLVRSFLEEEEKELRTYYYWVYNSFDSLACSFSLKNNVMDTLEKNVYDYNERHFIRQITSYSRKTINNDNGTCFRFLEPVAQMVFSYTSEGRLEKEIQTTLPAGDTTILFSREYNLKGQIIASEFYCPILKTHRFTQTFYDDKSRKIREYVREINPVAITSTYSWKYSEK